MVVVKVWGLRPFPSENKIRTLHVSIVDEVFKIPEAGVHSADDIVVLFPSDIIYRDSRDLVVEIVIIADSSEINDQICQTLASNIGAKVRCHCSSSNVISYVQTQNPRHALSPVLMRNNE